MMCELIIGRKSQKDPVGAFLSIRPGSYWWLVGAMGVLAGFIILSYYSVVAGWTIEYTWKAINMEFASTTETVSNELLYKKWENEFGAFVSSYKPLLAN